MKKILTVVFVFFVSTIGVSANELNSVNMDIYIDSNGIAHVTEVWDATYSEKTEGYKPYGNLGNSKFSDFSVSMDGRLFEFEDNWDINGSFNDKAYKNGFNYNDGGIELCFGISEYGTH